MPDNPGPPEGLTREQLDARIADVAAKAVAPALEAALKPLTESTAKHTDILAKLMERREEKALEADAEGIDKALGPYPIGRKVRALALATINGKAGDVEASEHYVKATWRKSVAEPTLKWLQYVKTSLTAGTASAAGSMIMPDYDPSWIELLRNNAVIRGIARTVPMPRGATSRRRQLTSGTAYYQGETDRLTASNQTVDRVALSYKKLTALTTVSNDLIRFSGGEADRFVQEDLLKVCALREDRAFLVGNPPTDAGSPQGIRYQTAAANINASAGTSLSNFQSDLTIAIKNVQKNNIMATPDNSYFLMSPSTFWAIYALTTTTGDWVFAQNLGAAQPRLLGYPVKITTQLETGNSFIGSSAGMIFFVHGPSLEIHDSMQRTVATYMGGAYYDASVSAVVSGISNDETVITCISEHDFLQVYAAAASVITGYST